MKYVETQEGKKAFEELPGDCKLKKMYAMQIALMELIKQKNGGVTGEISGNLTALMVEAAEMQNAVGQFKWWKKNHVFNRREALEEYVDILFFWLQTGILMGFDPEQIYDAYKDKWDKNWQRQINNY
jgi:NTP pyrophosphatase (non-canonical NTP hydrolase)